jgi:hypothetical protein
MRRLPVAHSPGCDERQLLHPANWNCRAVADFRVANLAAEKQSLMSARSFKGKCVPTVVKPLSSQFSMRPLKCDTGIGAASETRDCPTS